MEENFVNSRLMAITFMMTTLLVLDVVKMVLIKLKNQKSRKKTVKR